MSRTCSIHQRHLQVVPGSAARHETLIREQQRANGEQHAGRVEPLGSVPEGERPERSEHLVLREEMQSIWQAVQRQDRNAERARQRARERRRMGSRDQQAGHRTR